MSCMVWNSHLQTKTPTLERAAVRESTSEIAGHSPIVG